MAPEKKHFSPRLDKLPRCLFTDLGFEVNGGLLSVAKYLDMENGTGDDQMFSHVRRAKQLPALDELSLDSSLTRFVAEHDRGVIRLESRCAVAQVIAELAVAYSTCKIVVIAHKKKEVQDIARLVGGARFQLEGKVAFAHSGCPYLCPKNGIQHQIVCTTPIASADVDVAKSELVLLVDDGVCLHESVQNALATIDGNFRLFSICSRDPANETESRARMKMFGPSKLSLKSGMNLCRRPANFRLIDTNPPRKRGASVAEAIWFNKRRNGFIADIANGLADGRADENSRATCILVNNLRQLKAIAKKLPEWRIFCGGIKFENRLPGSFRRRIKLARCALNDGRRMIVLTEGDYRKAVPGYAFRYLIWASGGCSTKAIPHSWLFRKDDGRQTPLEILDFKDTFSKETKKHSRRRTTEYLRREIFPVGVSPEIGRIQEFLKHTSAERRRGK